MARSTAWGKLAFGLFAGAAALVLAVQIAHIGSHHVSELLVMHSITLPGGWNGVYHSRFHSPDQGKVEQLESEITQQ